jgi:hypothetical protein
MKKFVVLLMAMGLIVATAGMAGASIYASSIEDHTLLSNWDTTWGGAACHGPLDASVILGAPTGAVDGTGYTGWGSGQSGYVELGFGQLFADSDGDDLFVYGFGPGDASISVSSDGTNWSDQLDLGKSGPGAAAVWGYDLADFSVTSAQYVRIDSGMAKFFDAVKAVNPVPVPAAVWLLGSGLIGLVGARRNNH